MSNDQLIERWCKDHATLAIATTVQWLVDNFEPAEGSSIRRSILYNFYLEHCGGLKVEPLNPASFGKLIHSVFLGLKTRRLGTRGNSKYHYYGIQVKSTSPLVKQMPFDGDLLLQPEFDTQSMNLNMSPNEYIFSPITTNVNNTASDCSFPPDLGALSNDLPPDMTDEDVKIFQRTHDEYAATLYHALLKFQFDSIEKILQQFWSLTNVHLSQSNDLLLNDPMIVWKFNRLCALPFIIEQFRFFYSKFYQAIIDHYFPDVLTSLTTTAIETTRVLATNITHWFRHAIEHLYDPLKSTLLQYTQAFSSILLRSTSLTHLSLTVQNLFSQSARLTTMCHDLTHVNFSHLHDRMHWLLECDVNLLEKIEQCLRNLFQSQSMLTLHNWTTLVDTLLDDHLIVHNSTHEYIFHARQFLLKTNFYCSLVLRELTLHYGASLGSFHLLQLFIEEYLYCRIEQKICFCLNQSRVNLVVDNWNNQQHSARQSQTFPYLFADDELDDDLDSLDDDFHAQHDLLKPLSPIAGDDLILPHDAVSNSFSCIFEDLQPLANEIF